MPDERWVKTVPHGSAHEVVVRDSGTWFRVREKCSCPYARTVAGAIRRTIIEAEAMAIEKHKVAEYKRLHAERPKPVTDDAVVRGNETDGYRIEVTAHGTILKLRHCYRDFAVACLACGAVRDAFRLDIAIGVTQKPTQPPTEEPEMPDEPKVTRSVKFCEDGGGLWDVYSHPDTDLNPIILQSAGGRRTLDLTIDDARTIAALLTAAVEEAEKGQANKLQADPDRERIRVLLEDVVATGNYSESGIHNRAQSILARLQPQPLTPDPADRQCDESGSAAP